MTTAAVSAAATAPAPTVAAASAGLDVVALSATLPPTGPASAVKPAPPAGSDSKAAANPAASTGDAVQTATPQATASHVAAPAPVDPATHNLADGSGHGAESDAAAPTSGDAAAGALKPDPAGATIAAAAPTNLATTTPAGAAAAAAHPAPIPDQIASQLAAKISGASSRFDITLDPAGLGHVNVSVQINAAGQVTAAMTFDNPHAAAEARSGAGALQHALEQAGFNVAQGGLSFDVGGQGAGFARQDARPQTAAASFAAPIDIPVEVLSPLSGAYGAFRAPTGVDITI